MELVIELRTCYNNPWSKSCSCIENTTIMTKFLHVKSTLALKDFTGLVYSCCLLRNTLLKKIQ